MRTELNNVIESLKELLDVSSQGLPLKKKLKDLERRSENELELDEKNLLRLKNEARPRLMASLKEMIGGLDGYEVNKMGKTFFNFTKPLPHDLETEFRCDINSYGHAGDLFTAHQFIRFIPSSLYAKGSSVRRPAYIVLLIEGIQNSESQPLEANRNFSAFLCIGFEQKGLKETVAGKIKREVRLQRLFNLLSEQLGEPSDRLLMRRSLGEPDFTAGKISSRYASCCSIGFQYSIDNMPTMDQFRKDLVTLIDIYEKAGLETADFDDVIEVGEPSSGNQLAPRGLESPTDVSLLNKILAYRNVVLEGVAGTGKSYTFKYLESIFAETMRVVFHPSTSYEDFVEGIRPRGNEFEVQDGAFLDFAKRAAKAEPEQNFLLVIDEINRANVSKVLGDLLLVMEPSKRMPKEDARKVLWDMDATVPGDKVELQNERIHTETNLPYRQLLAVPDNLYILGTMNTTDRSVGTIDLALRRRFVFHRVEPLEPTTLKQLLRKFQTSEDHYDYTIDVDDWYLINQRLREKVGVDALIGHSYFFEDLNARNRSYQSASFELNIWRDQLLPQLAEVLLAFNAMDQVEHFAQTSYGGFTLKVQGSGFDRYPIVSSR